MNEKRFQSYLPLIVVVGMSCYQLMLCYVHTHIMGVNNGIVAAVEGSLLMLAALRVFMRQSFNEFAMPMIIAAYFFLMWAVRGEIDPQGVRNLFIIYIMFSLGKHCNSLRDVNIIIHSLSAVVAFFCFFEYFLTDLYTTVFNILQYYTARGLVTEEQLSYLNTNLYTSGMRPSGRTIMPFLGDQRVSSIFLEPVSMGNYAVVVSMWALSFNLRDWRTSLPHYLFAVFFIIACDSRFASLIIFLLFIIRFIPMFQAQLLLYCMPVAVVAGQAYFASLMIADWKMDDLPGRLTKAGNALLEMHLPEVFGIGSVEELYDMGIPYSLVVFGVVLCIFLWTKLVLLHFKTAQGRRMRAMIAVYCLGLLMISGTSFYSSKTAGALWFIVGALYAQRRTEIKPSAEPLPVQTAAAL